MEETKARGIEVIYHPRRLNLNLPLLSTRRVGVTVKEETNSRFTLHDTRDRIPFCWEQATGKPKDMDRNIDIHDMETPRPKLPPCRWHLQKEAAARNVDHDRIINVDYHDDGCDADVDEDENDGRELDVYFSDAVDDVLSLTEAIDIVQKSEDDPRFERLNLESVESIDCQSPNFMMERFLPDATALAASSALCTLSNFSTYNCPEEYASRAVGQSYPSSEASHKGCGLEVLFSWRMKKHRLCGIKSPVRQVSPKMQPQYCSTKHKKHCSIRDVNNHSIRDVNKHT